MRSFTDSVMINRPAQEVFALTTNLQSASQWMHGIIRLERLDDGALKAGSKFRETRRVGRREATAVIEVLAHDGPDDGHRPPYRHAAGARVMGVEAVYDYGFSDAGPGHTRIDLIASVRPTSVFGRLIAPMVLAGMRKQDGDHLQRLKRFIETQRN